MEDVYPCRLQKLLFLDVHVWKVAGAEKDLELLTLGMMSTTVLV